MIQDAIYTVQYNNDIIGTCFLVEFRGFYLILTCKHIFKNLSKQMNSTFQIVDANHNFNATIIHVSDVDLVVMIPIGIDEPSFIRLYQESMPSSGAKMVFFGYSKKDSRYNGNCIQCREKPVVKGPIVQLEFSKVDYFDLDGFSGSPLLWEIDSSKNLCCGMFLSDIFKKTGCFLSSEVIFRELSNAPAIIKRLPTQNGSSLPNLNGIWKLCLDDTSELFNSQEHEVYSEGFIDIHQHQSEITGNAVNLLFHGRIKSVLFASFIYDVVKSEIKESSTNCGDVKLEAVCYLQSKMYSGDNVSTVVQDLIQTLKKYPNNVYLRILASIDTNVGRGSGQWSILDSDREGVFSIDSHRYSIKIPSLSTKILKSLVFEKELKRNLAKDYIDSVPNTCYHVIIDYQGVIIAQCRETPYANLVPKEKKIYRVFNEEECTYLSKFCVRQDFRNTGIAHRLGACVVKHLFNKGVRIIALNICPRHLFLYKRIGFVECGNQFFSDEVGELVIPLIGDLHKIINHRALIGMLI